MAEFADPKIREMDPYFKGTYEPCSWNDEYRVSPVVPSPCPEHSLGPVQWDKVGNRLYPRVGRSEIASPLPAPQGGQERVLDFVIKAFQERAEMGREKYGQYLMTHDGRDTDLDALQEAFDLTMYLAKKYMETHNVPL